MKFTRTAATLPSPQEGCVLQLPASICLPTCGQMINDRTPNAFPVPGRSSLLSNIFDLLILASNYVYLIARFQSEVWADRLLRVIEITRLKEAVAQPPRHCCMRLVRSGQLQNGAPLCVPMTSCYPRKPSALRLFQSRIYQPKIDDTCSR